MLCAKLINHNWNLLKSILSFHMDPSSAGSRRTSLGWGTWEAPLPRTAVTSWVTLRNLITAVSQLDNKQIGLGIERLKTSTLTKKLSMIPVLG